jgi:hypothetical protein
MSAYLWIGAVFDGISEMESVTVEGVYGERGCKLVEIYSTYTMQDHEDNVQQAGQDQLIYSPNTAIYPLLFLWGEVDNAVTIAKRMITMLNALQQSNVEQFNQNGVLALAVLPTALHVLGENAIGFEFLRHHFGTFDNILPVMTRMCSGWDALALKADIEAGRIETGAEFHFVESLAETAMAGWLLTCPKDSLDPETHFAKLSEPAEMQQMEYITRGDVTYCHHTMCGWSPQVWAARAYERFGFYERALAHTDMVEEYCEHPEKYIGDAKICMWNRSLARGCAGRILARQGRMDQAAEKFKGAVADARARSQYTYLAALAIRDWNTHVREPAGERTDGAAPLAAAMDTLGIGRKEQVTELMAAFSDL